MLIILFKLVSCLQQKSSAKAQDLRMKPAVMAEPNKANLLIMYHGQRTEHPRAAKASTSYLNSARAENCTQYLT